ncbi:MAG: transglycosylase SLT domain-containing protein [Candidatus Obscuribacterales bacterium]|jgi:Transglycosylase SLT domain/N-acetylmuramoyl-L-alanine amidase|nr:transglycosylase SLT domain-containing protein [Candidatus Obscuribacterales bacterium]
MSRHPEVVTPRLDSVGDGSALKPHDQPGLHHQAVNLLSSPEGRSLAALPNTGQTPDLHRVAITDNHIVALNAGLNPSKPLSELSKAGVIDDKTVMGSDAGLDRHPATDKEIPRIAVQLENKDDPGNLKPHFVIKEDGKIEMRGNPETLNSKDIQINLERKDGQVNPTEAQTKAADELVKYLAQRISASDPAAAKAGIELNDKDDVVSKETEQKQNLKPTEDLSNVTPQTRSAVQDSHRLSGSRGVDMPGAATDGMMSHTRGVPRQPNETDKTMGVKEAVAGLWRPDHDHPYETIRKHPDGSYRVGRYGFSGKQLNAFMESLGDPPDPAMIEKLIKEGKLPKDFAEKLKNPEFVAKLKGMADKMNQGQAPGKSDIATLLPKEAQEAIATNLIDQLKTKVGDQAGAISAGLLSGKAPKDFTAADLSTPEAKQLSDAGQRLFDVAMNQQQIEQRVAGRIPTGEKRDLIEGALTKAGVSNSAANIAAVNLIVQRESGWNPNIVNNWDSNARKGTPSKGLMQTIGPTFDQYSIPGHKNILNPEDNLIAGIRYAVSRYGSLQNVPGVKAVAQGRAYRGY